jgi:sensor c-di-GMP phosphodiesterase-like protein
MRGVPNLRRRSALWGLVLIGVSVGLFVGAAKLGGNAFVDGQNGQQLTDLTQQVLRRAELEVDFAIVALSELAQKGVTNCRPDSLVAMRRQVYENSTVKDIRIVDGDGNTKCSAFAETLEFDMRPAEEIETFASRNSAIRLARLEQQSAVAMGVLWRVSGDVSLVAVVNTDTLLFAVLPRELRDHGNVQLLLADGNPVAQYFAANTQFKDQPKVEFTATSERYPFTSCIAIAKPVFATWNRGAESYFLGAGGVLGLAFGSLLAGAVVRRRDPISELDQALAVNEFKPFLQPIVSLKTGDIVGCEVLVRWVRPDGTVDPPHRFIHQAEDSGRIVPLTHQLVTETLDQLRSWMTHKPQFKVAFNIYPGHLMADGFVEELTQLVDTAEVSRSQVVIEITERQELDDLTAAGERIAELRKRGFKVAIDDAGTGHSGLSYLQRLGVNIVKIDKLFVDSIELDYSARVIVEMLVKVADELGMTTVAEGVERAEQVAALKACGVDEIQGFYVSPAIPTFDFLRLLYATGRPQAMGDGLAAVRIA